MSPTSYPAVAHTGSSTSVDDPPVILVVDDDAGIRTSLKRCLGRITRHVREAADGIEALAVARASIPEGLSPVIVDVAMPRMNGLELYSVLRTDPMLAAVPVLFISGESNPVPEGTLLQKPFNARKVRTAVQSVLAGIS